MGQLRHFTIKLAVILILVLYLNLCNCFDINTYACMRVIGNSKKIIWNGGTMEISLTDQISF